MEKSKRGNANKRKGNNAERLYAKLFKNLGWKFTRTSRSSSRLMDDSKVDLTGLPLNIQIKAGIQKGLNPFKELQLMEEKLIENFEPKNPVHKYPKLLIWRMEGVKGKKRDIYSERVYMTVNDLVKLIKQLKEKE